MAVIKVIELIGVSSDGWEDAVKNVVREACRTIDNVTGVEVMSNTAVVKEGELTEYKATVKVAFAVTGR